MTSFQKFFVTAYRHFAVFILLAVLATGGAYALITLFYVGSSTWAAPVVVSQSHQRILQLKAELFRTQQSVDALDAALVVLKQEAAIAETEQAVLLGLTQKADASLAQQRGLDRRLAATLQPLEFAKISDSRRAEALIASVAGQEDQVRGELSAGLISREDATRALAGINAIRSSATDAAVAAAGLRRQVEDLRRSADTLGNGSAASPHALDLIAKAEALKGQLARATLKLAQARAEMLNKSRESAELKQLLSTLEGSPYFRVAEADAPINFAFVPYTNEDVAKPGAPVYDCMLQVLLCKRVGTVKRVYRDEEKAPHPLFKTELRGVLAELELSVEHAAKSRVVFLGTAPLLF